MPIANLQHIQHLKKAIPLPKVPESLDRLFNQDSLKETFSNPDQLKAFLVIQCVQISLLLGRRLPGTPEEEILFSGQSDTSLLATKFQGVNSFIKEVSIYHALHRHTDVVISLRKQFEYFVSEDPNYFSDTGRMLLQRIEDDLLFLLEDPYNNYLKYVSTFDSNPNVPNTDPNHMLPYTRMDLTREAMIESLEHMLKVNQGQACRLANFFGKIYAGNADSELFRTLEKIFPNALHYSSD